MVEVSNGVSLGHSHRITMSFGHLSLAGSLSCPKEVFQKSDQPYIKPCFDFLYFAGFSPFRFTRAPSGKHVIGQAMFQKVWHIFLATIATMTGLNTLRFAWIAKPPIVIFYFQLATMFSNFSLKPASFYLFWRRRETFPKLIHVITKCPLLSQRGPKARLAGIFFCALCLFRAVLTSISGQSVHMNHQNWTPSLLFASYVSKARFSFNLDSNASLLEIPRNMSDISSSDIFLTAFLIVSEFIQTTHYYLLTLFLQLSAFTLFEASSKFSKSLKEIGKSQFPNPALDNFYELKSLSNAMNETLGPLVLLLLLFYGLYFSTDLDNIFVPTNWMLKSVFIMDFLDPIIFVIASAEACLANDRFRSWLCHPDNYDCIPKNEVKLSLLLDDLWTKPVGIRGSEKFVIDYTFVGHVSVVILTLFVVVLQSKYN